MFTTVITKKQAKMQWLQDQNKNNVYNLNNVKRDVSKHLKKNEYMKAKIDELEASNNVKRIRDLYRGKND